MGEISIRRILLGTMLALLVWLDVSSIYNAVGEFVLGKAAGSLGGPNIWFGLALLKIPVILVLVWLTYRVWNTLRQ